MLSNDSLLGLNMINNDKNIAFWDKTAERFGDGNAAYAGMLMDGRKFEAIYRVEAEQARFLTIFTPTANSRVLEVGSGGGRWGFFLAPHVARYTGLDISPKMISIARDECARRKLTNAQFECLNLLDYQSDEKFDLIFFSGVLQYMDDETVSAVLDKAAGLLEPDGSFISRDSVQLEKRVVKTGDYPVIYRTPEEYRELFNEAGFVRIFMDLSYPAKRFTNIASRIFNLPGISYRMAAAVRDGLCTLDNALGNPAWLKTDRHKRELRQVNQQEHRFFKYVRQ